MFGSLFLIMKSAESARYSPQQGGLEGGLEAFLDHFGGQVLIIKLVMNLLQHISALNTHVCSISSMEISNVHINIILSCIICLISIGITCGSTLYLYLFRSMLINCFSYLFDQLYYR